MAHIPQMLVSRLTNSEKNTLKGYALRSGMTFDDDAIALVQLRLLHKDFRNNDYHLTDLGKAVVGEIICREASKGTDLKRSA